MAEKFKVRIENCPLRSPIATPRRPAIHSPLRWVLVALPLTACGGPADGDAIPGLGEVDPDAGSRAVLSESGLPHTGSAEVVRGELWFQDWKPVLFKPCGEPERVQVALDGGGVLEEEFRRSSPSATGTLFTEALGVARTVDGRQFIWLQAIRAAGHEGMGCTMALDAGGLRASGNEPGWSFVFRGEEGRLATIEATRTAVLANPLDRVAGWPLDQDLAFLLGTDAEADPSAVPAEGDTLVLRLSEGPCHDSMSGTRFPFRATVQRAGETRTGCAVDGRDPVPWNDGSAEGGERE